MEDATASPGDRPQFPGGPIRRLTDPIARFLHVEAAGGAILLAATAVALIVANSPASQAFLDFWNTPVGFQFGDFVFRHPLKHWINDGLMVVFFFVIGLEVKRELVYGELRELRRALFPVAAALGGMVAPACIYLLLQHGQPGEPGWGIPMATDIAFVVGCMAVLGPRVPKSLRIIILTLAIADDIGAILVIAIGYSRDLHFAWLAAGALGIAAMLGLARLGVRGFLVYVLLGVFIWYAFHESGVHATIAGVILGLLTPAKSHVGERLLAAFLERARSALGRGEFRSHPQRAERVRLLQRVARETISPLEYLENVLHPWVGFVIMPVFALANAGVPIKLSDVTAPVAIAVMLGLVVGKPLGIVLGGWLSVQAGLARLPDGVGWPLILAGGCLAGIGFTMALFIASLALEGALLDTAKIGILTASAVSATVGMLLLAAFTSGRPR